MSRKTGIGIVVSLVLSLVFTMLIVNAANRKYEQVAEKAAVARTTRFIAAGEEITQDNVTAVEVPKSAGHGLATVEEATGKVARVSMVSGQYVHKEALEVSAGLREGYVEVFVPVDLSSSALAIPGQTVNVHVISKDSQTAPMVVRGVRVLHSVNSRNESVADTGDHNPVTAAAKNSEPAAVGLEIAETQAEQVIYAASQKLVYLSRTRTDVVEKEPVASPLDRYLD